MATMKNMDNVNRKCGEITFCTQVGKRVYALNCLYCPQICLQWDIFIYHMEQEHDEDLNLNPALQVQTDDTDFPMNNKVVEPQDKITPLIDEKCSKSKRGFENNERDQLLQNATVHTENFYLKKTRDEADIYAEAWAYSYRKLSVSQKIFAKKACDDIFILGLLRKLTFNSISTETSSYPSALSCRSSHMEQEHGVDFSSDLDMQMETNETGFQRSNIVNESQEKITSLNYEVNSLLEESDRSAFDDPLGDASSTNQCLESSIKIENVECAPNLPSFNAVNNSEYEHIDSDKNNSELSIMTENNNININNNENSQNLTTLQKVFNTPSSEGQKVIQPVMLEDMLEKFLKTIEPMFRRLTNEVTSLRQEITDMHSELKKEKTAVKLVMPENPYKVMDEFLNFEKNLQDDKKFLDSFQKELVTVAKAPNFTKNCWRKLLVDELAEKLCWKGTEDKKSVRSLSATKAIRNAAISIGLGEDEFIKNTKSFFQFAKTRQEVKSKYKARSKK